MENMCEGVKKITFTYLFLLLLFASCGQGGKEQGVQAGDAVAHVNATLQSVAIDTMDVANPFIIYDKASNLYYMTGDGGQMWRSTDMSVWEGPFDVLSHSSEAWMGKAPLVTAPEIHLYNKRYYYMATFSRPDIKISSFDGEGVSRTSCEIFVSDNVAGPYKHVTSGEPLLNPAELSLHPTFCTDYNNVGYMIYTHGFEQNGNATVQIVRLGDNFDYRVGEPFVMFRASQNSWSTDSQGLASRFMEAPFYFETLGGRLGVLFTAVEGGEKVIGVAYTQDDAVGLNGPWHIEPKPLLSGGVSGATLFTDYDGRQLMLYSKDTLVNGKNKSLPRLMRVDTQFDKLILKEHYKF